MELGDADVVLVRHGETTYNALGLLNGDPAVDVPLTEVGIAQCRALRPVLEPVAWAAFVVSPFARTAQSLAEMLPGASGVADPDLGDIRLGVLESQPRDAYRAWRRTHGIDEAPEGGESRLDVVARRTGLGTAANLRALMRRQTGLTPSDYRRRFTPAPAG